MNTNTTTSLPVFLTVFSMSLMSAILWGCVGEGSAAAAEQNGSNETVLQDEAVKNVAANKIDAPEIGEKNVNASAAARTTPAKQLKADVDTQEMVLDEANAKNVVSVAQPKEEPSLTPVAPKVQPGTGVAANHKMFEAEIIDAEDVMLNSIILAKGVSKREPVEPGTQFTMGEGEKIYAILDVKNSTGEPAELTVSWKKPNSDTEIGKTSLNAKPGQRYRTWSFTRWAKKAGKWEAIVRNPAGDVIARAPFEVVE